jgi:rhodanese-related sulfurtransferase
MSLPTIEPAQACRLLETGAILIDIREPDEHSREKIPGAWHMPLSKFDDMDVSLEQGKPVIFYCKSGARTQASAPRLARKLDESCEAFIIKGGLGAWRKAKLPILADRRQPLELHRQVQIGAGSLALTGTLLGLLVSPWAFILPASVGAGLVTAGVTGFCGMARVLIWAPWNTISQPMQAMKR